MTVDTVPSFVSDDSDFDDLFIDDDNDSIDSEIPDENIDFDLVYALRTFVATTDGQTSVVKGDALVLLDDSNSYWWLVKASSETGYIPAENIETPFERLARLNKHRNTAAEVDSTIIPEIATPTAEASHSPQPSSRSPARQTKRVKMSSQVQCQVQIVLESIHDDEYEELYEEWDEELINDIDDEPINYSPVLNSNFRPLIITNFNDEETANVGNKDEKTMVVCDTPPYSPELLLPTSPTSITSPTKHKMFSELANEQRHTQINTINRSPSLPSKPTFSSDAANEGVVAKGLRRLLSIGSASKKTADASPSHHLRIFSGNIQGRIEFSVVAVTPEMNTEQVIQLALQKFHIQDDQPGVEYFMTVKSMDSDEITLMPQDKPLGIFESLTDHLTTPMPSLKHIKRLSLEQPSIKVTRVGVSKARQRAKAHFGEASDIQFALHQRIKRTTTGREGQMYVKMIYYAVRQQQSSDDTTSHTNGLVRKSSLLHNADRMEKLVSVRMKETMRELVPIALDKFHLARENPSEYCICLPVNGKGVALDSSQTVADVLNETNSNGKETVFVLVKESLLQRSPSTSNRGWMGFLKQQEQEQQSKEEDSLNVSHVIRRLDHAIQSIENDKRQLEQHQLFVKPPMRSNSLSTMSRPILCFDKRRLPARSSSLRIVHENSNIGELQNGLQSIALAHHGNNHSLQIS